MDGCCLARDYLRTVKSILEICSRCRVCRPVRGGTSSIACSAGKPAPPWSLLTKSHKTGLFTTSFPVSSQSCKSCGIVGYV